MKIEKTNYGLRVNINTWPDTVLTYELRQVRILNRDDRHEQKLINEIEKREAPLTLRFLNLARSMEYFFKQISIYTHPWWEESPETPFEVWEKRNKMDWNEYYQDGLFVLEKEINDCSMEYCERSRHGWCY